MDTTILTLSQSIQLVALAPCLLIMVHLLVYIRQINTIIIPFFYFVSLSAGFVLALIPSFIASEPQVSVKFLLMLGEHFTPALSFLLILQFIFNRPPPVIYWLILAVPGIGGGAFTLLAAEGHDACLIGRYCIPPEQVLSVYNIVSTAMIFMLLIAMIQRFHLHLKSDDIHKNHKYWLIIALISLNLLLLCLDLAHAAEAISEHRYLFVGASIKALFIYVVLSSIFRVFTNVFPLRGKPLAKSKELTTYDLTIAERAKKMLQEGKVYRELGLNRALFAEKLGVKEHYLSHIINRKFQKSVTELINVFRIEEAKERLAASDENITTICYEVGFNNMASFNRIFKNMTGKSPSGFRKEVG